MDMCILHYDRHFQSTFFGDGLGAPAHQQFIKMATSASHHQDCGVTRPLDLDQSEGEECLHVTVV